MRIIGIPNAFSPRWLSAERLAACLTCNTCGFVSLMHCVIWRVSGRSGTQQRPHSNGRRLPKLPATTLYWWKNYRSEPGCLPLLAFQDTNIQGKSKSIQQGPLTKGWRANIGLSCTKHPSSLACCLAVTLNLHIKILYLSSLGFF